MIGIGLIFGVFLAVLFGALLGIAAGYNTISMAWSHLGNDGRAIATISLAITFLVGLLISYTVRVAIRQEMSRSIGRVDAYNSFIAWYSATRNAERAPDASTLTATRNSIILWGRNRVIRQISLLHDLLAKEETEMETILKKAEHVFIEIKRDLGHGGFGPDRSIV